VGTLFITVFSIRFKNTVVSFTGVICAESLVASTDEHEVVGCGLTKVLKYNGLQIKY